MWFLIIGLLFLSCVKVLREEFFRESSTKRNIGREVQSDTGMPEAVADSGLAFIQSGFMTASVIGGRFCIHRNSESANQALDGAYL